MVPLGQKLIPLGGKFLLITNQPLKALRSKEVVLQNKNANSKPCHNTDRRNNRENKDYTAAALHCSTNTLPREFVFFPNLSLNPRASDS